MISKEVFIQVTNLAAVAQATIAKQAAEGVGPSFPSDRVAGIQEEAVMSLLLGLDILPEELQVGDATIPTEKALRLALRAGLSSPWLSQGATMLAEARKAKIYQPRDKTADDKAAADSLMAKLGIK